MKEIGLLETAVGVGGDEAGLENPASLAGCSGLWWRREVFEALRNLSDATAGAGADTRRGKCSLLRRLLNSFRGRLQTTVRSRLLDALGWGHSRLTILDFRLSALLASSRGG